MSNLPTKITAGKIMDLSLKTFGDVRNMFKQIYFIVCICILHNIYSRSLKQLWHILICFEMLLTKYLNSDYWNNLSYTVDNVIFYIIYTTCVKLWKLGAMYIHKMCIFNLNIFLYNYYCIILFFVCKRLRFSNILYKRKNM